jgi:type IV pilus assembly protein PilE
LEGGKVTGSSQNRWVTCNGRHPRGFTLIELMVAVAVVAILASIAYPLYVDQVVKARRSDGQSMLMELMNRQEQYYTNNNTFTTDLTDLGYGSASDVPSEEGWYDVSAAACGGGISDCVALTAEAQAAQENQDTECNDLTLDSLGNKGISGGSGTAADCW